MVAAGCTARPLATGARCDGGTNRRRSTMEYADVKFTLSIGSSNAALVEDPEGVIAEMLQRAAAELQEGLREGRLRDPNNGQLVGRWELRTAGDADYADGG